MIAIRKSHKGSYEVNYQKPIEVFKRRHGDNLKKEIGHLLKNEGRITVCLGAAVDFSKNGYKSLRELMQYAEEEKCRINFTYFGVDISHKIELLSN